MVDNKTPAPQLCEINLTLYPGDGLELQDKADQENDLQNFVVCYLQMKARSLKTISSIHRQIPQPGYRSHPRAM